MSTLHTPKEIYSADYPSSKMKRKKIIDTVVSIIRENAKLAIKDHELYLIVDEAISNAMEHGNLWNPNKNINIKIYKDDRTLTIKIKDEGKGFHPDKIEHDSESIKPRGRGIHIIRHFCDIKWNKKGNQVELIIPVQ